MARSHGVVKVSVWTPNSDFRTLTKDAQRAYVMLLSQPQINNCGVLPYTPKRWARYAANDTLPALTKALLELAAANFIVIDVDTGELLVRTFVKHDKIADQPNLKKSAMREYGAVESDQIRGVLFGLYPWLAEGVSEPLPQVLPEPLSEPLPEGGNAHARAAPTPSPKRNTAEQSVSVVRPAALPNKESLEELGQRLENANGRAAYGTVDSVFEVIDKPAANTRRELEKWLAPLPAQLVEHVREQVLACEPRKSKAAYAVGTAQRLARERGAA